MERERELVRERDHVPVFAVEDGELAQDPGTAGVVRAGADEAEGKDSTLRCGHVGVVGELREEVQDAVHMRVQEMR